MGFQRADKDCMFARTLGGTRWSMLVPRVDYQKPVNIEKDSSDFNESRFLFLFSLFFVLLLPLCSVSSSAPVSFFRTSNSNISDTTHSNGCESVAELAAMRFASSGSSYTQPFFFLKEVFVLHLFNYQSGSSS